jgi:formylmethanofuran dehydrogenase subunit C
MSRLTLRLREDPRQRIDLGAFTPDRLAGKGPDEISRIPLWHGNRQLTAGELFEIAGNDCDQILVQAESDRLDAIGMGMTRGEILVEGQAGAYLGQQMRGGAIRVTGSAGSFAGMAMHGGNLRIDGSCGPFLGGAIPGEREGMRDGLIQVMGDAGDRVGDRLRRGTILIAGKAGDYCGARMGAGTIVVLGATGAQAGLGMRRGSLLLATEPDLPVTFNDNGTHGLTFLTLFLRALPALDGPLAGLNARGIRVQRWVGDLGCNGKGEVLLWR